MDIGTPADYLDTALAVAAREGRSEVVGTGSTIARTSRVERSVLWDRVTIGDGAALLECIVTDGVTVPPDTSWHGVTLRRANGELADGERVIGNLAIGPL
jgi:NDP-sugar pyrophosphorylase family protein